MIDISVLRALAAAGASVDAILAAIEAEQAVEIERVQARRAKDAARQRRRRHAESHDVTRSHADAAALSLTTSLESDNIKKNKDSKKERATPARKTKLSEDWIPNEAHYAKGTRSFVERKAEDMRNWAKSKGIMRVDWDATFHGFLRPRETSSGSNGHGAENSTMAAFDRLIDRAESEERGAGPPMRDITPRGS